MANKYTFNASRFRSDFRNTWGRQKDKAAETGLSQSKICRIETGSGKVKMSVEDFTACCNWMAKNPADYFTA